MKGTIYRLRGVGALAVVGVSLVSTGALPGHAARAVPVPRVAPAPHVPITRLGGARVGATVPPLEATAPLAATWSQQAEITPTAAADFGVAVAASGNSVLIGADYTEGAYVYVRQRGAWTLQAQLVPRETTFHFGYAVALSGTTAVVGAYGTNSTFIFARSGTTWSEQAFLTAPDSAAGDQFGRAVGLSGDTNTVLVGSPGHNGNVGAAYVFTRSGTTWSLQQEISGTGVVNQSRYGVHFGYAVGVSSDRAIVGAPANNSLTGAAFAFVRSGTTWSQQQVLTATDGGPGAAFGQTVALEGTTVAIGSPGGNGLHAPSSVYVYVAGASGWTQQAELSSPLFYFGYGVALSGDTLVVGYPFDGNNLHGAADVFVRRGSTWNPQAILTTPGVIQDDLFGDAVGVSGNTAIVGAPTEYNGGGAAYIFVRHNS